MKVAQHFPKDLCKAQLNMDPGGGTSTAQVQVLEDAVGVAALAVCMEANTVYPQMVLRDSILI